MRPLRHGCLHDVRDASLVCELSQFKMFYTEDNTGI